MSLKRMSVTRSILLGSFLPIVILAGCLYYLPSWRLVDERLHSVFEAIGLFAGIFLAVLLLLQVKHKQDSAHYSWISGALIGMGILDGFHATIAPGNGFVWLHSIAVLLGGFLFAMVWLPLGGERRRTSIIVAVLVAVAALAFGVGSYLFPGTIVPMIEKGEFTHAGWFLNIIGGAFFIGSALFFFFRYRRTGETEDSLFVFFCLLNGFSGLFFPFGGAWDASWWLWHLMRLAAYLLVLGHVFTMFQDLNERKRLSDQLERRTEDLTTLLGKVKEAVNTLAISSDEILASSTQIASSSAETAVAINETTTTVEEVRQAALLSAEKAKNVSDDAQRVAEIAGAGRKAVEDAAVGMLRVREQMESISRIIIGLSEQNQSVGSITMAVSDLADQSNLLAVNAAIEAARAGDQGKGFSVVAQEIKSLAEQSKQATARIREILTDVQKTTAAAVLAAEQGSKAVDSGVRQSETAGESIRALAESSGDAARASVQIAASSQQQVVGMNQIGTAMENVNLAGAETAASMRQVETAARNLHELGQALQGLVERSATTASPKGDE